jgi:hypothetical protein
MRLWSREPGEDPRIDSILILLDTLNPAERCDLANALLRAAWSASLEETRVLLLDVVTATDAAAMWEAGG